VGRRKRNNTKKKKRLLPLRSRGKGEEQLTKLKWRKRRKKGRRGNQKRQERRGNCSFSYRNEK